MDEPPKEAVGYPAGARLHTIARIYLHGCLAFVVIYVMAYVVTRLIPIFEFVGSPGLAIVLSVATILLLPPLVGAIVLYGLLPLLGKKTAWSGVTGWDNRLLAEVTRAKEKAQVVIINWPSPEVRTFGVLTSTFAGPTDGAMMASVYVPTAPHTRYGYVHVVPLDQIEFTDWTFRDWQLAHLTFGAFSPSHLAAKPGAGED